MGNLRLIRDTGPEIEFTLDRTLVGREATCDVVVDDKSVSRKHAYVERRGEGWAVLDQGSANGTFVGGQRVAEAELRDGQELRLGTVNFRVEIESVLPGTVLMAAPELEEPPATVLMPNPELAPPAPAPRAPAPPPRASAPPPRPVAPPRAAAPPPAPPRAATPPPAPAAPRARNAQQEAAEVLGVAVGASPDEVRERYEELSRDLQVKLANARTPVLKSTYEKNLVALRKAYTALTPASASVADIVADLPSAQPVVGPDFLEGSAVRKRPELEEPPLPEAAHAKGASILPPATSFFVMTSTVLLALAAFFSLSSSKLVTEIKKEEESPELVAARQAAAKYEAAGELQKNGALRNGKLKLCNRSTQPLDVAWLSAVYVEKDDLPPNADLKLAKQASGYKLATYNSAFCFREYKVVVPPGGEQAIEFKSQEPRCSWDGSSIFYAFSIQRPEVAFALSETPPPARKGRGRKAGAPEEPEKKPGDPGTIVWFSGLLNGRSECIPVGAGW